MIQYTTYSKFTSILWIDKQLNLTAVILKYNVLIISLE